MGVGAAVEDGGGDAFGGVVVVVVELGQEAGGPAFGPAAERVGDEGLVAPGLGGADVPRVGEVDYPLGFQIDVPPAEIPALRTLLQEGPTALALATWYRDLPG